ncbi:hypothetical protein, partial [Halobacterium sp. CBA1126]|uniref:DUF7269 family protein n=1 Tax=Halobacterium sp. CBA1126 TaxID=2668074 RepID=UPI003742798E
GVAVAVGVLVGLAPASLVGAASGLDATLATGVVGAALVGYALRRRRQREPTASASTLADEDGDSVAADPGQPVDGALDRIADDDAFAGDARTRVRERVRETAVRAVDRKQGVDDASEAVASGEWTSDPVAAAFLGDERAPRYPLRERLRGWVHPDRAFRRRVERTVDAVHALATEGSR